MDRDDLYDTLNDLIETCEDGKLGFAEAADHVTNPRVKTTLADLGLERGRFAAELRDLVRTKGGEAHEDDSAGGAFHRAWLNLKDALGGGDHAVLAEAERGEDHAVSEYEDALEKDLPADVQAVVSRQFLSVKSAHDRVRALRDSPEISAG
jgi:uncharacterized protein (TIGR02284 family)